MTKPNRKQVVDILVPWIVYHAKLKLALDPLSDYLAVENPLSEAAWGVFDAYTDLMGDAVGDELDWLQWWQTECGMGAKEGEASPRKGVPVRKIRNLSGLAWLIVESRE